MYENDLLELAVLTEALKRRIARARQLARRATQANEE